MERERAPLSARADASIIKSGDIVRESAPLRGIFTVECVRPRPGCERQYEQMWRYRHMLQQRADLDGRKLSTFEECEIGLVLSRMRPLEEIAWRDVAPNTVCTLGKNLVLDSALEGAAYTVTGPFLGLISSVGYSATAAADTMASHAGWVEAGGANAPTYTAPRKTAVWDAAAAGVKALTAALPFAITGAGTVKGCILVFGTGAVSTIANGAGTLMSAGVFSGGDKVVDNLDTLNVSYSLAF